jgi:hypothetical protein
VLTEQAMANVNDRLNHGNHNDYQDLNEEHGFQGSKSFPAFDLQVNSLPFKKFVNFRSQGIHRPPCLEASTAAFAIDAELKIFFSVFRSNSCGLLLHTELFLPDQKILSRCLQRDFQGFDLQNCEQNFF